MLNLKWSLEVFFLYMCFPTKVLFEWKSCGGCILGLCVSCKNQKLHYWEKMCNFIFSE